MAGRQMDRMELAGDVYDNGSSYTFGSSLVKVAHPHRDVPRTLDRMLKHLWTYFESNPTVRIALPSTVPFEDSVEE